MIQDVGMCKYFTTNELYFYLQKEKADCYERLHMPDDIGRGRICSSTHFYDDASDSDVITTSSKWNEDE